MEQFPFVFTVFLMLLGPFKLIPSFAGVTRGMDVPFKRSIAIRAALIAAALCAFVAFAGESLLGKYHISIHALRISAALILLISALQIIFQKARPASPGSAAQGAIQIAASPVAVPGIVPPAGVAAILIFMMLSSQYPGLGLAVAVCLAIILALDFLVMYFIDQVMKTPGLMLILAMLGAVLVFMQVCLAVETFLGALKGLGLISG